MTVYGLTLSDSCMDCIRKMENGTVDECTKNANGTLSCGPFRICEDYWKICSNGGKDIDTGKDWQICTKQLACSEKCVKKYMALQEPTGSKRIMTCQDIACLHHEGPKRCADEKVSKDFLEKHLNMC
ncbi:unnamed protein product [Darwinula stevensoni]|uniref:lysozyme n=1 Tax=Darwinula stevensoni TaxID=69355 RepID=A0A7R9A2H4_9CRUS|nr:unnamed protein product [Darwinula stevensoni]CAG0889719.1 unnamed protein product [Darwinula stevensoni]